MRPLIVYFLQSFIVFDWYSTKLLSEGYMRMLPRHSFPVVFAQIESLEVLEIFNNQFLGRQDEGRKKGLSPMQMEFRRAQELGPAQLLEERLQIRESLVNLASCSKEIVLGIMAENSDRAISVLRLWVTGLGIKRGVLRAVDENNAEVDISSFGSKAVYVKYNSTDGGDAYIKPYAGENRGVIFQPLLEDGDFRQFGDFPLAVFPSS
eukprot:gene13255-28071_t